MPAARRKQNCQQDAISKGIGDVRFFVKIVMNDTRRTAEIDKPVQQLPPFAAQTPYPFLRGRDGKRNHQRESDPARSDKWTARDILYDVTEHERLVQPEIDREVDDAGEECQQPHHAPHANQAVPARKPAQWSYREGDHQEAQRPDACNFANDLDGITADPRVQILIGQPKYANAPQRGQQTSDEYNRLYDPPAVGFRHWGV